MSTIIMAACWPVALPPVAKFVLMSLADQANDDGVCWPKVASICTRTCYGERAVQLALRQLQQQGLLDVEIGAKRANRYTIKNQALRALLAAQNAPPDPADGCTTCTPHHMHPRTTCTPHDVHPYARPRTARTRRIPIQNPIPIHPPYPPSKAGGLKGFSLRPRKPNPKPGSERR